MAKKKIRAICLTPEIDGAINETDFGCSFSKWVEDKFTDEFYSTQSKRRQVAIFEEKVKRLKVIIEAEEKSLKSENFYGFCPVCGEPVREVTKVTKEFAVCSYCWKSRSVDCLGVAKKVRDYDILPNKST